MKKSKLLSSLRKFLSSSEDGPHMTCHPTSVDVREEYANAFRTESYIDFWTRVLALNNEDGLTTQLSAESTPATRLSSYRLFAEQLLDPPQPTVKTILASSSYLGLNSYSVLLDYFSHTANTSLLCSRLLKHIDHLRLKLHPLELTLQSLENKEEVSSDDAYNFNPLSIGLAELSNTSNPFALSAQQVQIIQHECSKLLKRLEFSRDKAGAKLKRVRYFQRSSAGLLVAVTVSLTVIVVIYGIALLVAAPCFLVGAVRWSNKSRRLGREVAQLNVAAKGTYTLNRDFDTIGRLVARLSHELEHMRVMARFWVERGEDRRRVAGELVRQLKQNHANFSQQLDELEEHLYLCFMTINRARNLVVKQV